LFADIAMIEAASAIGDGHTGGFSLIALCRILVASAFLWRNHPGLLGICAILAGRVAFGRRAAAAPRKT